MTEETETISYEDHIEALVDVYRQEFLKLSIEEIESIPVRYILVHASTIKLMADVAEYENDD